MEELIKELQGCNPLDENIIDTSVFEVHFKDEPEYVELFVPYPMLIT